MPIQIKRVYDPPQPQDGKRILVDRLFPRGIRREQAGIDEWLRDIAPSGELRRWFGHDPSRWQEFRLRYRDELQAKAEVIAGLRKEAQAGMVTLLYAARDPQHNNAVVLREWLEEL